MYDTAKVLKFFKALKIDCFYCSPYTRSIQTIAATSEYFAKKIKLDERLRERECGLDGNNYDMFRRRWEDLDFHEKGGESIHIVQNRNIAALHDILIECDNKTVVVGTHGTALSSILNYFDHEFNCDSFLRIIDWMPYIVELDFEGKKLTNKTEHLNVEKEYTNSK